MQRERHCMSPDSNQASGGEAKERSSRTERRSRHALVYVEKLTKLYPVGHGLLRRPKLLQALRGVTFYIRKRETLGIVGESGSGKSTLGRCILRLVQPTLGRVVFDGKEVTALGSAELRALRRRMQIVFQDPYASLDPNMTVAQLVAEGIEILGIATNKKTVQDKVMAGLEQVGLSTRHAAQYPHELSGGQAQRVAIARSLAVGPDFVVLDEPLSALDLSVQAQIINLLDDLQQSLGLTQLFISHDLRAVQYMSHRVAVMHFGKIVEIGPTELIVKHRRHPYTRALFSAVPRAPGGPRSERQRLAVVSTGDAPSALDPPAGCAYFTRCPNAEEGLCDREEPPLREMVTQSHHRVACFHPHD